MNVQISLALLLSIWRAKLEPEWVERTCLKCETVLLALSIVTVATHMLTILLQLLISQMMTAGTGHRPFKNIGQVACPGGSVLFTIAAIVENVHQGPLSLSTGSELEPDPCPCLPCVWQNMLASGHMTKDATTF